jgi:hypothetical protein
MNVQQGNTVEAVQHFFEIQHQRAQAAERTYSWNATWRLWLAYALKAIAVLGGVFIAIVKQYPEIVGGIVAFAVAIDQIMANQRRLVIEQAAAHAVQRINRQIEAHFNQELTAVTRLRDSGHNQEASNLLTEIVQKYTGLLSNELDRVETARANSQLELLASLNIENANRSTSPSLRQLRGQLAARASQATRARRTEANKAQDRRRRSSRRKQTARSEEGKESGDNQTKEGGEEDDSPSRV